MIAQFFAPLWAKVLTGLLVAALAFGAVQTFRIEGLRVLFLHIVGFKEEVATLKLDLDKIKAAQIVAAERAAADKLAEETRSRLNAERIDNEMDALRAAARAATERYRMRSQAAHRASSNPTAPADDHGPQGADGAGEGAVMVSGSDLDILVENTVRLKAAIEWAKTLNVGEPESAR